MTTTGLCIGVPAAAFDADPLLGRTLVFSNRTSRLGRALQDYGVRSARDPRLGDALAGGLLAGVREAIDEPLGESRAAIDALKAPSCRPGASSTGGWNGRAPSSTPMTTAASR